MCHLELSCLQIVSLGQGTSLGSDLKTREKQAEPVSYNPHPWHWEVLPLKLYVFLAAVSSSQEINTFPASNMKTIVPSPCVCPFSPLACVVIALQPLLQSPTL